MLRHQSRQTFLTRRRVIVEKLSAFLSAIHDPTYVVIHAYIPSLFLLSPQVPLFLVYHKTILPARILDECANGMEENVSEEVSRFLIHGSSYSLLLLDFRL